MMCYKFFNNKKTRHFLDDATILADFLNGCDEYQKSCVTHAIGCSIMFLSEMDIDYFPRLISETWVGLFKIGEPVGLDDAFNGYQLYFIFKASNKDMWFTVSMPIEEMEDYHICNFSNGGRTNSDPDCINLDKAFQLANHRYYEKTNEYIKNKIKQRELNEEY